MSGDRDHTTNPGGAPDGLGGATGADPRGPSVGGDPAGREDRSFAPTQPGHTSDVGEGGGAMSGRGQEVGPDSPEAVVKNARGQGTRSPGQGGNHLLARAGGEMEQHMGEDSGGMGGDVSSGANESSGTGVSAGGDAHLSGDGRKLGDPMDARRQTPSDGAAGGLANGSGAD